MVSKKLSKYIWFGLQSFREEDDNPGSPHYINELKIILSDTSRL